MIGVVQEQHADRARLYKQWRRLNWPIFVDSLNVLGHKVVPIPMLIDPNGRIYEGRFADFLKEDFEKRELPKKPPPNSHPADALFYKGEFEKAIAGYTGTDAATLFKRGVAQRAAGRGQAAVESWAKALALDPNQYIWRRRLQQYGPRLAKPYNFYSWIEQARAEIRARGEEPVPLGEEPRGAELIDRRATAEASEPVDADPKGRITRDTGGLVELATMVTPTPVLPGHRVRVRLVLEPKKGLWNNESGKLTLFVAPGAGLALAEGQFTHPNAKTAESKEARTLEFELKVEKTSTVKGYALYYVCEKEGGTCLYLRRDFEIRIRTDPKAARIQ